MGWLLPPATALVIVVVGVLVLIIPQWMHASIHASGGDLFLATSAQAYDLSDRTVNELLFGPGTFSYDGPALKPFYTDAEAAHLRDARALLYLFVALAVASFVFIVAALAHRPKDVRRWRAVARGGAGLAVGAVVVGVIGWFAFEPLFELFHRVFFPGGNWEFPADSNMIRLY
ncbi:MAG TPA: DUF1461 domain-containing protein, partial [Candidatus Limnocylindria bacterium]|nr:DUF1461 domain-containing protein [Candidatus Limnocylindria bacterium]